MSSQSPYASSSSTRVLSLVVIAVGALLMVGAVFADPLGLSGGGDGFGIFAEGDNPYDFGPPLEEVVADYIAKQGGTYTPYTDGRITQIK